MVAKTGVKSAPRVRDAEATQRDILAVSVEEFADKGLSGARIDEIVARTNTSKRMIYYYFGSKEGLYIAVLEHIYATQRSLEKNNDYARLEPDSAMERLIGASFDHHVGRPNFISIVMDENLHHGRHVKRSENIKRANESVIEIIREILDRGVSKRVFRSGVDPVDLHLTISALSFHFVANRHTFASIFDVDMTSPQAVARRRRVVIDLVMASIRA